MAPTFGPEARLRKRAEFTEVQAHGRRVSTKFLTVLSQPNAQGRDRLGLIASRKLGGAVMRNRAKRRLRELFRAQQPAASLPVIHASFDIVIIPRREVASVAFPVLQADFATALRRVRAKSS
jgi:ribonuclease P protein component